MTTVSDKIVCRFWSYTSKTGECWEWQAGLFSSGYGQFRVGKKKVLAHRFAAYCAGLINELAACPQTLVLHTCDNKKCCRPDHLFVGSHQDNLDDMIAKKRDKLFGGAGKNPKSKLSLMEVQRIKLEYAFGNTTQQQLADKYGVAQTTVSDIVRGSTHKRSN